MVDKRRQRRYRRRLLVKFGETDLNQSGFTTDMSATGIFIQAPRLVTLDSHLHLQVFFASDKYFFFEGEVRRHKQVPLNLRTVERGGFGVRFLSAAELVAAAVGIRDTSLELHYATREELQKAFLGELRVGGVFVPTTKLVAQDTDVTVDVCLDFVDERFEFPAKVVHVSSIGVQGLGLVFADKVQVQAALQPYLV
jgi:Tfp pilus assembly protein PilZ